MTDRSGESVNVSNANDPVVPPDPQGRVALLLIESLIHGLIAKATLSIAEAVEIIDIAADVKLQLAEDGSEHPLLAQQSLDLLTAMASSLRRDLAD